MSYRAVGHPDGAAGIVDAVPDAARARDLELPLLEVDAVHAPGAERALERMLTIVALARIGRDPIPRSPRVGRRGGTDLVPALHRVVGREAELPRTWSGRRGDTLLALGHGGSAGGPGHEVTRWRDGPTEPAGQLRICVDLGSRAPLVDELG